MSLGGNARARFLCDAERCIECNACVTACKNENEVPGGLTDVELLPLMMVRLAKGQSLSLVCTAQMLRVWRFARSIAFIRLRTVLCYTLRIFALVVDIVFMRAHLEHHNFLKLGILALEGKWTNVLFVLVDQRMILQMQSFKNMVETGSQKESFQSVLRCVRQKLY